MKKIIIILSVFWAAACTTSHKTPPNIHANISEPQAICYEIAENLAIQLKKKNVTILKILKTPFVDIDNVESASTTGRAYAEFIATRLCQLGYEIIEIKIRANSIKVAPETGEIILSYDKLNLTKEYAASAVLTGYYKSSYTRDIAIFARIIDINENTLLAADDVSVW